MSLFNRKEICSPFIKHLVEPVFTFIKPYVMSKKSEAAVMHLTDDQLQIIQDATKVFEVLAGVIPKDKRTLPCVYNDYYNFRYAYRGYSYTVTHEGLIA